MSELQIEDSSVVNQSYFYSFGGVLLALVAYFLYAGGPHTLDYNSPEFNPLMILMGFTLVVAVGSIVRGLGYTIHSRRFGRCTLNLVAHPRVGSMLEGRVLTNAKLDPRDTIECYLFCLDRFVEHEHTDHAGVSRNREVVRWETRQLVHIDPGEVGIPLRIPIGDDAYANDDPRKKGVISWVLEVRIKARGFFASFGFRVGGAKKKRKR